MDSGFQVLDSGSFVTRNWIPNSNGWWIPDSLSSIPDSKTQIFRIPQAKISRIPKSGFLYMGVYVDCVQSLFLFRFSEGSARARERRETREMRVAARKEK